MTSEAAVLRDEAGRRELRVGLLYALLLLGIWVSYILMSRFGLRTNFAPADLLALRVGVGGLVMLPWFVRGGLGGLTLGRAVVLAMTAGIGFGALSFNGFVLAHVSHAAALQTATLPLFTAALSVFVLGERFSLGKRIGLVLIVVGVVFIGYESLWRGEPGQWRGDILFASAALDWAVFAVLVQRWRVTPKQGASVVYVVSAILYLPVYFIGFEPRLLSAPVGELVVQGLLQGVISNLVSLFAFTRVMQAFGASSTAMLTAGSPLLVTLLAIPLLGEIPSALAWVGLVCVTAGIVATVMVLEPRRA